MKQIWWVQGEEIEEWEFPSFFETKECAERYARMLFPDETESKRYSRIFYRKVLTMSDLNGG